MGGLEDIVDRAIGYTERILEAMPSYKRAAIQGLMKLQESLARKCPGDPALDRLDAYLNSLKANPPFLAP